MGRAAVKWFNLWFALCAVLAIALICGVVWMVVDLRPHLIRMMDRVGQ